MRAAILVNEYPSPSHTFIREEILGLEAAGVEVVRIAIRGSPVPLIDAADLREARSTTTLLPPGQAWRALPQAGRSDRVAASLRAALGLWGSTRRRPLAHLAYAVEALLLGQILEHARVGWLHVHHGTNAAAAAAILRACGGPPWSITIHGPEDFESPARHGLPWKLRSADRVFGVSDDGVARLRRQVGPQEAHRVHLVRCGVSPEFLAQPRTPCPAAPRLVCVGRLCRRKGHDLLLHAIAAAARTFPSLRVECLGGGPEDGRLSALARRLGIASHLEFSGWADAEQIRAALRRSRALVLASRAEGLPVVIMEALALGRPAIATDVGGVRELVIPGLTGWLVAPDRVAALESAIEAALRAPTEDLDVLGQRGRELVCARHDARKNAAQLADHINARSAQLDLQRTDP